VSGSCRGPGCGPQRRRSCERRTCTGEALPGPEGARTANGAGRAREPYPYRRPGPGGSRSKRPWRRAGALTTSPLCSLTSSPKPFWSRLKHQTALHCHDPGPRTKGLPYSGHAYLSKRRDHRNRGPEQDGHRESRIREKHRSVKSVGLVRHASCRRSAAVPALLSCRSGHVGVAFGPAGGVCSRHPAEIGLWPPRKGSERGLLSLRFRARTILEGPHFRTEMELFGYAFE